MKMNLFTSVLLFSCLSVYGQFTRDLNIKFMLRGHMYAASSESDSMAMGGFARSDNYPKKITDSSFNKETGLFLKIDVSKTCTIADKFNGYYFYVGNKTDSVVELRASDSRLSIVAEALVDSLWQPIEYLPRSFCGMSYHSVSLGQNEYWEFQIPKFKGKVKSKVRYKLRLSSGVYIYSNEIAASINRKQLIQKQGHVRKNIMDPYLD
jgi:hypothetical protein